MTRCSAQTANGKPCQAQAIRGRQLCFVHDPAQDTARAQARKLGGQRRRVGHAGDLSQVPSRIRSLADVTGLLDHALADALILENSIQRGRLLVSICAAYVDLITSELESRVGKVQQAVDDLRRANEDRRTA
jgi:hypothetical protein